MKRCGQKNKVVLFKIKTYICVIKLKLMIAELVGEMFSGLFRGIVILFLIVVVLVGVTAYSFITRKPKNIIETKTPPVISWKLVAKGQSVDTIWIYNFNKQK